MWHDRIVSDPVDFPRMFDFVFDLNLRLDGVVVFFYRVVFAWWSWIIIIYTLFVVAMEVLLIRDSHLAEDEIVRFVWGRVRCVYDLSDMVWLFGTASIGVKLWVGSPFDSKRWPFEFCRVEDLVEVRCVSSPNDFFGIVDFLFLLLVGLLFVLRLLHVHDSHDFIVIWKLYRLLFYIPPILLFFQNFFLNIKIYDNYHWLNLFLSV